MRKLEREDRRKMKLASKKTSKRIKLHQIELLGSGITKEVNASFHTDPSNFGMVREIKSIPYSISTRNLFY
jgi:hypothetical protein